MTSRWCVQEPAFAGTTIPDLIRAVSALDPDHLAGGVPAPWDDVIRRALVSDPAARTITMREIAEIAEAA